MDADTVRKLFGNINIWKRGNVRAPHKPLLLLYALAYCDRGAPRLIPYKIIDKELRNLLVEFGPFRKSYHPEYPFWRLQNDNIWELTNSNHVQARIGNSDAKKSELFKYDVHGGFIDALYLQLQSNSPLRAELAGELLESHFPSSLHADILTAVGLDANFLLPKRKPRNREFRDKILTAYEFRCAVCGWDVRLANKTIGLEAAHIKWQSEGGPDIEANGLALCALHHKLFDRGAFTVSVKLSIEVSQHAHGTTGADDWLLSYHGKTMYLPQSRESSPRGEFIRWHQSEVFRPPARTTS